ncbi:unnamed protein product, partial [Polarella glacialis]
KHPVLYVKLRRLTGQVRLAPSGRFFAEELSGFSVTAGQSWQVVIGFDAPSGLHQLEDGQSVDLTAAFASGKARFRRPLHEIMARCSRLQSWPPQAEVSEKPGTVPLGADRATLSLGLNNGCPSVRRRIVGKTRPSEPRD